MDDKELEHNSSGTFGPTSKSNFQLASSKSVNSFYNAPIINQQNIMTVIPDDEKLTDRPLIDATIWQKLAFYRSYSSTLGKLEQICMQNDCVNRFLWFYTSNVLCKTLPMAYVYFFLSVYVPDSHLFLSKMVPITYGTIFLFATAALIQLYFLSTNALFFLHYVLHGVVNKVPWNRCDYNTFNSSVMRVIGNRTYSCYTLETFTDKVKSHNITFLVPFYYIQGKEEEEGYQISQVLYFFSVIDATFLHTLAFIFIWILAALHYNQLFKPYIWKTIQCAQFWLNVCLILIGLDLFFDIYNWDRVYIQRCVHYTIDSELLLFAAIDIVAESMTAPPLIHLLSSRSINEVKPSRDSAILIASNGIYYIFKGFISLSMKRRCRSLVKFDITATHISSYATFYFWTIYFTDFYLGDFYVLIFFALNFIVEICVFMITFQCQIEVMVREGRFVKRWLATMMLLVGGVALHFLLNNMGRVVMLLVFVILSTLIETIIIFWMYPIGRLRDDISFHYGSSPTMLRMLSFQIVPVYYLAKTYFLVQDLNHADYYSQKTNQSFSFFFIIALAQLGLGAILAVFYYKFWRKTGWMQVFTPLPEWGPKNPKTRYLRKQFDSREYIESQGTRELSRHMIRKAELKTYRIDVKYEDYVRPSLDKVDNYKKSI